MKPNYNTDLVHVRYRERVHPVEKIKKAVVGSAIALLCMCGISSSAATRKIESIPSTAMVAELDPRSINVKPIGVDDANMLLDLSIYNVLHDERVGVEKSKNEIEVVAEANKEKSADVEPTESSSDSDKEVQSDGDNNSNSEENNNEEIVNDESELADASEESGVEGSIEATGETVTEVADVAPEEIAVTEEVEAVPEITYRYMYSGEEYNILCRVTEAEVTGDSSGFAGNLCFQQVLEAKIHVAQVILNRVDSPEFPDTIEGVVFQQYAFSSVTHDGRYYDVTVTDLTRQAVEYALNAANPDTTYGALYFTAGSTWNAYADYLFTDAVNHSFFR